MEENKPFMPPPPPKMPPFPPQGQAQGKMPVQEANLQSPPSAQPETVSNDEVVAQNDVVDAPVETVDTNLQSATETFEVKKEPASKDKKKNRLTTALYWGGFVLCLVGIALCIYFVVK